MNQLVKDIGHYVIIVLTLVYILPYIFIQINIPSYFGIETKLYKWVLMFVIYLVVFIILDKVLHKQFGLM